MKRTILGIFLFIVCCGSAHAWDRGDRGLLRWELEWGYGSDIFKTWSINYIDSEVGYRVWDEDSEFGLRPNAYVTANFGIEPTSWMGIYIFTGLMSIGESRNIIPAGLQATFLPKGNSSEGLLFSVGGGIGMNAGSATFKPAYFAQLGTGWRLRLNPAWDLDLVFKARFCKDSPPIWDEDSHNYVKESNIRKNVTVSCSLQAGIVIGF